MTVLVLLRHGESAGNREGRRQGLDSPLSEEGRRQAELLAERLSLWKVDAIYSSDMVRAKQTASIIASTRGLPVVLAPALRETDCGILGGLTMSEARERFPERFEGWTNPFDLRAFNGEHVRDMELRVNGFLESLIASSPDRTICLVTHGGPIKALVARVLGLTFIDICDSVRFDNAGVTVLECGHRWVIRCLNDTAHLVSSEVPFTEDAEIG